MNIRISATYEGVCDICGKEKSVFTAGDEDSKKVVTLCKDCVNSLGDMKTSDVIEKHGKINEDIFKDSGMKIKGIEKLQEEMDKLKKKDD